MFSFFFSFSFFTFLLLMPSPTPLLVDIIFSLGQYWAEYFRHINLLIATRRSQNQHLFLFLSFFFFFQMEKLQLREIKYIAQCHTASKMCSLNLQAPASILSMNRPFNSSGNDMVQVLPGTVSSTQWVLNKEWLFIHSFHKYLLSIYHVPSTVTCPKTQQLRIQVEIPVPWSLRSRAQCVCDYILCCSFLSHALC